MRRFPVLLSFVLACIVAGAASAQESSGIPDWFLEHIRERAADGGLWITDNAAYLEEDGGIDAYGTEWTLGLGGRSMTGRLFGLRDGEEVGTYWEFRVFWHPGLGEARIYQFGGNGAVGIGSIEPPREDGTEISVQTFYNPDGSELRLRHVTVTEGDREDGRSENWVDGAWAPRRSYVWHRQR